MMKKSLLAPVFSTLMIASVYAADPTQPAMTTEAPQVNSTATTTPTPSTTTNATSKTSSVQGNTTTDSSSAVIDCNYHISSKKTSIDATTITTWAKRAVVQSFSFSPEEIQTQLEALKPCYTEQGWKGFNDALQKSGNVDSIKKQQLNVSSQIMSEPIVNTVKDGQWKVSQPVQVVYQNADEKVTQLLSVTLLIGRKSNGDLGIMQLIAVVKPETTTSPAAPQPEKTETPK